jgi:hypothetical protein
MGAQGSRHCCLNGGVSPAHKALNKETKATKREFTAPRITIAHNDQGNKGQSSCVKKNAFVRQKETFRYIVYII